ncbi:MAG: DUF5658 family protein [Candidatus Cloacimonetes bacterium]|nr:DUF5658 family protein [Candidatus Cloacimonadota bacterium]
MNKIYQLLFCSINLPLPLLFALLLLLVILNILDAISTWKVVKLGSNRNERNPIARFLFNKLGPLAAMLILKGIAIIIIAYVALFYKKFLPDIHTFAIILNAFYLYIVIHNYHVLKKMKSRFSATSS